MPRITGRSPNIPLTQLQGKEIKPEDKVVETKSHEIQLATEMQGSWMPDLKMKRREIADPGAQRRIISDSEFDPASVSTGEDFKAQLTALIDAHKDYLQPDKQKLLESLPEGERSNFAYINIVGRRNDQFFDEAMRLVGRTDLRGGEAKEARQAINHAHRDAFRGRSVDFDRADTGTYWSYGHDAPFTHVFEKMLETLPEDDPKRAFIQNQLDFIFTHKYVDTGAVKELDCEKSLGLVAIDKDSRHVVSMKKDTEDTSAVRYETLRVPEDQGGPHAGKHVYRDGDQHYFEGGTERVPDDLVAKLERQDAETVVFGRASGNKIRSGFQFDWNGNRMLDVNKIDTGWWGHCDIKATMETILADMGGSGGVTEYNSASDKTTEFNRDMQLEALAAMLNFDDTYLSTQGGRAVALGDTGFAGARFDNRPSKMVLKTGRWRNLELTVRLKDISEKGDPSKSVDLHKAFAHKVADDKNESFEDNPAILRTENGDTNYIDGSDRRLEGTTDGYTFDKRGRPVELKQPFEIDLENAPADAERVLLGSELKSIQGRELTRTYLDPHTRELIEVDARFERNADGDFEAKEGAERKLGKLEGVELGREMTAGDDVQNKIAMLEEAVRSGGKIATDSDTRDQVWNGEVHAIKLKTEWRSDDGMWERVGVHVDATFGQGKVGTILHKLDEEGEVVDSMEVKAAVDFYWKDRPRVAPLVSERGNWYVNKAMHERGVVDLGDDMMSSLGAITDMNDLIYLGLKARDNEKFFTIAHQGKRLVYSDKAAWEADVKKLKEAGDDGDGGDVDPSGPIRKAKSPDLGIPDNDPAGIEDSIRVDEDGKLKDIAIDIDVKHTWVGDLNITLVAPDGDEVKLHKRGGRGRDDIAGTYGADGDLKAHDDLAALKGKDVNGDWKLKINDMAGRDVGTLVSWGLNLETE